jgi:ribose transport system substrate-binding protein
VSFVKSGLKSGIRPLPGQYRVGTLEKGLNVLELLENTPRPLTIQEISSVTDIQRVAVFRLLCTLEHRGYVERLSDKKYRATARRRRARVGYCAPLSGSPFRVDVAASVRSAVERANLELLVLDTPEGGPDVSLKNSQRLVDARVDVAILFQPAEWVGHTMADCLQHAGVPFISIEIPLAGGIYFGANNFHAGRLAGQVLAKFAAENWKGNYDRVVLVESSLASTTVPARLAGVLVGLQDRLGPVEKSRVIHLDGRSHSEHSRDAVAAFLQGRRRNERLLIGCFNDPAAMGALEAVRAAGREKDVAIVGQNATAESRKEIRNPHSRFIASIAYFPERYGERLVRVVSALYNREPVAPAVYTEHLVIDSHNVEKFYRGK